MKEKEFKDREREVIMKPYYAGGPLSHLKEYFNMRVERFRNEHPVFDNYLKELNNLIKREKLDYCSNISLFIEGNAKTNWISPRKTLFNVLIKLYNYDLSPQQTIEHIKKCYEQYLYLKKNKYVLRGEYELSKKRSDYDGTIKTYISLSIYPDIPIGDYQSFYWFDVSFSEYTFPCDREDIKSLSDGSIDIYDHSSFYEDALMLFEYYQGTFLKELFDYAVNELFSLGVLRRKGDNEYTLKGELGYNHIPYKSRGGVEQLINHPDGTLSYHRQHLFCYSPIKGAFIVNNVCYVDSRIKKIDCVFSGQLDEAYYENGIYTHHVEAYDTIIFNSKVDIKLSSIVNPNIRKVYFINDVNSIDVDVNVDDVHIPLLAILDNKNSNIYKFIKEHKLPYEIVLGNRYQFL